MSTADTYSQLETDSMRRSCLACPQFSSTNEADVQYLNNAKNLPSSAYDLMSPFQSGAAINMVRNFSFEQRGLWLDTTVLVC